MSSMAGLTVLVGGARSGKSSAAARLAESAAGPVTFVATAEAGDDDMGVRIERHRAERPAEWTTVEEPRELERAIRAAAGVVVVDCLTLWVANLIESGVGEPEIVDRAAAAATVAAEREGATIVVTNEVGSGIVPSVALARRYRDALGRTNQEFAGRAARTWLLVAGRVVPTLPIDDALVLGDS